MTDEVIEVVATPIDTDVRRVGEFGAWVADAQGRADAALAKYVPAPIADEAGYGRAKKERTAVRKVRGEIDAERKLRLREVEDALKALKERVKEVTGPLDEAVRESENAGTRMGVVVHHRKGRGTALIADSYVTMRLGDFAALLLMILRGE